MQNVNSTGSYTEMSPAEFVAKWASGDLVKWSREVVEPIRMSQESKEFLVVAGLPADAGLQWRFGFKGMTDLPRLTDILRMKGLQASSDANRYRVLGVYGVAYGKEQAWVCVDEAEGGRIVQLTPGEGGLTRCFVNSGVPHLAECILVFRKTTESSKGEDLEMVAELLRRSISSIDSQALREENSFWSVIVEEAGYGM